MLQLEIEELKHGIDNFNYKAQIKNEKKKNTHWKDNLIIRHFV